MAKAGQLREVAVFERLTSGAVDAMATFIQGGRLWPLAMLTWLSVLEKEAIQGGELSDVVPATLRLRKDSVTSTFTHADRVTVRGALWAIKSIVQTDRKGAMLEVLIERGVAL
jgi:head-tail adaptor